MSPEENGISPDSSLIELGIDSLVAVDVRAWFTKELAVEVQVLMLLGGASIATLIEDTVGKLDRELIPNVKGDAEVQPESEDGDASADTSDTQSQNSTLPTSMSSSFVLVAEQDDEKGTEKDILPGEPKLEFEKTVSMPYGSSQFWFALQYLEDPHVSNIEFRLELNSNINISRLEQALRTIGQRHEALRTAFFANPDRANEPTLGILSESTLEFVKRDISDVEEADIESKTLLSHTYDIERGQVAKVILLSLNPGKHFLIFGFHHIAIDGFSFNLVLNEMNSLYEGKPLPEVQYRFSDWAVQQRREVETGLMSKELSFWRNELGTLPDPLPLLPMAKVNSRHTLMNYEFAGAEEITLNTKTTALIKRLCRRHKVSMFNFFLAIFKIFLFRFIDTERICIGFADAGRGDSNTHQTVGYLLNLLPLVFEKSPEQRFVDALKEARTKSYNALLHSKLPFRVLLDELKVPRSSTYSPLFQVFMDYRQLNADAGTLGAQSSGEHTPGRNANDIILDISTISSEEIRATFKVQKSLYSQESAEIMLKSYLQLVKAFALDSDYQLSKISLLRVPLFQDSDIKFAEELARGKTKTRMI
jgi:hybrid polyketide synthase / nonribosomal peptide synthetase ACE1